MTADPYTQLNSGVHLTLGEMQVLTLMISNKYSLREIKDAVQLLRTTDMNAVEKYLFDKHLLEPTCHITSQSFM